MSRFLTATWLLLLAACLGGCPHHLHGRPGRPAWLVAGSHNAYPPGRFLFAAGAGASAAEAERAAAAEMGKQLQQVLERATESLGKFQDPGGLTEPRLASGSLLELLPRPRPGPRWSSSDGTRHAAALVCDKHAAAARLRERFSLLAAGAAQNLAQAQRHLQADEVYPAFKSAWLALAGGVQALRAGALAGALDGAQVRAPEALAEAARLLTALLDSLEAKSIRGNRQWLDERGRAREPLVAGVYARRGERVFPVADLPVRFIPPEPARPLAGVTNDVGLCSRQLPALAAAGKKELQVRFGLDVDTIMASVAGRAPAAAAVFTGLRQRLGRPLANFSLLAAGKQAPRFITLVEERAPLPFAGLRFAPALAASLSSQGFRPVEPGPLADDLAMSETVEEYAQVLRGHVEVLVSGRVVIQEPRQLSDNFVLCRAEAHLVVVAPERPEAAANFDEPAEAAGLDRRAACRRALSRLVERAGEAVRRAAAAMVGEHKP